MVRARLEKSCDDADYVPDSEPSPSGHCRSLFRDGALGQTQIDGSFEQGCGGDELNQNAFEFADASTNILHQRVQAFRRKPDAAVGGLAAQDRPSHSLVGRFKLGEKAAGQLRPDSGAEMGHILGQAVAGEQDSASGVQNVLDRVEELELGRGLALEKLDILHHEELMASPIAALEVAGSIAPQGR